MSDFQLWRDHLFYVEYDWLDQPDKLCALSFGQLMAEIPPSSSRTFPIKDLDKSKFLPNIQSKDGKIRWMRDIKFSFFDRQWKRNQSTVMLSVIVIMDACIRPNLAAIRLLYDPDQPAHARWTEVSVTPSTPVPSQRRRIPWVDDSVTETRNRLWAAIRRPTRSGRLVIGWGTYYSEVYAMVALDENGDLIFPLLPRTIAKARSPRAGPDGSLRSRVDAISYDAETYSGTLIMIRDGATIELHRPV